ncbi:hypothetical protein [Egicoccus halophilus]|uniref:Uncharacterized protein n=1 Tax=Egicoccus halophilus TaxID=1670830 RepID=A0A8J3AFW1_9ACTN|nr:hypothetical protein [Egicoccus halophilus]GGI07209.1 hypothetical protein GCM10011354_22940 [Egicoccus halophilus]
MDDDSGWNDLLVGGWHAGVRDAVVVRVERASVGHHGELVRTLSDPDGARYAWVESLHRRVLGAIRAETGADLDELGSQAAWACYEDVWERLRVRWGRGGRLARVPLGGEPDVVRLLHSLPPSAAEAAGADISCEPPDPLWLHGRLLVDLEGLAGHVAASPDDTDLRILAGLLRGACRRQ